MTRKKGLLLPAISGFTLLVVGLALVVFLPLPEERSVNELSQIRIKSVRWNRLSPSKAVEELNREIQKVSDTRYRFIFGKEAIDNLPISFELDDAAATEVARYLSELSSNYMYPTAQGIIIDRMHQGPLYHQPSWRRDLRHWLTQTLPYRWERWCHPAPPDPFAPP